MIRHKLLLCLCSLTALSSSALAAWPSDKPIEIVVGFAPGGGTDLMARKLAPFVQKHLGSNAQFVVVNKPGASGELANTYVARAKPDGYTLGIVNSPAFEFVPLARKSQYQVEDFVLVARIVQDPTVMVTRSESKIDSLQAVIGIARQAPGSISVGHNGEGSNGDLVLKSLKSITGADLNPIAYKGTGSQKTDVLGGHVALGTMSAAEVPELHKGGNGNLKVVVQFSEKRSAALPNVPTAKEAGVPVLMYSERGLAGPKGMDSAQVARLEKAIVDSLKDPEFLAAAAADAPVLSFMGGAAWSKSIEKSRAALKKVATELK